MYWIYLSLFIFIVFIPDIINGGISGYREESVEELLILIVGGLGFFMYLMKEKKAAKEQQEKKYFQKEANRMSKDLTSSYSYIGEINRKLEIFKNISLGLPEWSKLTLAKELELFEYIMSAIKILTRMNEYEVIFVDTESREIIKEIKSDKKVSFELEEKYFFKKNKKFFETDKWILAVSPNEMEHMLAGIFLKKKNFSQTIEDCEILKAIASQVLFLYAFSERRRQRRGI